MSKGIEACEIKYKKIKIPVIYGKKKVDIKTTFCRKVS